MVFKIVLALCAQALVTQDISAQCIGTIGAQLGAAPLAAAPCAGAWGAPYAAAEWDYLPATTLSASNGPGVAVATASPLLPAGVSVLSENTYEGTLAVDGALPFLGTVAFDGALPSAGTGVVAYNCGNGAVGITAEDNRAIGSAGINGPLGYGAIGTPLASAPLCGSPLGAALLGAAPLGGAPLGAAPLGVAPLGAAPLGTYAGDWGAPYAVAEQAYIPTASLSASNGPGLAVSSTSPLIPTGVTVQSENAYEGALSVVGAVPFLGTVAFDGALPTTGAGLVAYACGNGAIGITAEDNRGIGLGSVDGRLAYGSAFAAPSGIARSGWGCGAI